jgi:hypothetical protein
LAIATDTPDTLRLEQNLSFPVCQVGNQINLLTLNYTRDTPGWYARKTFTTGFFKLENFIE